MTSGRTLQGGDLWRRWCTTRDTGNIVRDPHFRLLSFLIASARGCIDEPHLYGSLRLIDAAARLIDIMIEEGKGTEELLNLKKSIEESMNLVMHDEKAYIEFLDGLVKELARIIKRWLQT
ncbi:MAG: DUF6092 family protein [Ignisphaera sp.]|nr:DUF6092 family protein [Ignisphaera sp.]MDW8084842.1 DUF6092 family protein [Ignisphaera sp.]